MKRFICVLLVFSIVVSMSGCSGVVEDVTDMAVEQVKLGMSDLKDKAMEKEYRY